MLATWIETAAKGRLGGPVRAGMWSTAVIGTHPIQDDQRVWVELSADALFLGVLPAYWIENKGGNSLWIAPIPPQGVKVRLHYRSIVHSANGETAESTYQDTIVRPNLPDRVEGADALVWGAAGLVGNRMMTALVDPRGSTYDLYFPTVGLHSSVRPREGDLPQSRCHFRAIVGGLAVGRRLDWFTEQGAWDPYQQYLGVTNLLTTKLSWRRGPIKVMITDMAVMGDCLPANAGREKSPGQYIKRFWIKNDGTESCRAIFAVYVQAEVNGGVGDVGFSWHDGDRSILAINRGHPHATKKLARDATVEFALALDERGEVECEPTGPNEAILFRPIELPAKGEAKVDMLISGAFTGWTGDRGTFEHWLRPALNWFRGADLDKVESITGRVWDDFVEPIPDLLFPKPAYGVHLRRSALAAAMHADAETGAVASGFDRGLNAYCWPRDAIWVSGALERVGHPAIGRGVYQWLNKVRQRHKPFLYWFQKYSIDGVPEWETPAVDQTALIPWGLERHYRRTGDLDFVASVWPMIEQACKVCCGDSGGHPGLRMLEDLNLISSAGSRDQHFGAFLYSNACVVAGLRAAARIALALGHDESNARWSAFAERIWSQGILPAVATSRDKSPGLFDPESGRFLNARRLSKLRGFWTEDAAFLVERSPTLDITALSLAVPFGLLPASDPRLVRSAEAILRAHESARGDPNVLGRSAYEPAGSGWSGASNGSHDVSSQATFWMVRFLAELGRETGQARYWTSALALLDGIISRISQLGLSLRSPARGMESGRQSAEPGGAASNLHAKLIDTMLDLAGLDYDAVDFRLSLRPALFGQWTQTGIKQSLLCGEVWYLLVRPLGTRLYRLHLKTNLKHPVTLEVNLTCPGLSELGPWQASSSCPDPSFDPHKGQIRFSVKLPAEPAEWIWTWG
jgi:glucoamylase